MIGLKNSPALLNIVVIGAGCSGVAAAYHLYSEAATSGRRLKCTLVEPRGPVGAGVAYATQSPAHLLNVRAAGMSICDRDPQSFARWLISNFPEYGPHAFVPRNLYQRYLEQVLSEQREKTQMQLEICREEAISIDVVPRGGYVVTTASGGKISADFVVLAAGNLPFKPSFGDRAASALKNPWDEGALAQARTSRRIAVVGTGLTAIDAVLGLEALGSDAHYTMISRHGHLPSTHLPVPHDPVAEAKVHASEIARTAQPCTALRLFRNAVDEGVPWRDLIDSLRPFTQPLWASWPAQEKRRFLRHLRCPWDTHRHRVPLETHDKITALQKSGRLAVVAGTVLSIEQSKSAVEVSVRKRGQSSTSVFAFDAAFNGMGLIPDIRKHESKLLDALVNSGQVCFDEIFLGLQATEEGRLLRHDGSVAQGLYTLGPLRRGELWETTAVREIRTQAQKIAKDLLRRAEDPVHGNSVCV